MMDVACQNLGQKCGMMVAKRGCLFPCGRIQQVERLQHRMPTASVLGLNPVWACGSCSKDGGGELSAPNTTQKPYPDTMGHLRLGIDGWKYA